eukprot:TRINITY_DN5550_c0_g1_i1.p1 TRINITY_DN5550_c0_g1~~TRINITY_DN5550_c0_g1_i1.p1  ORF type:complete len:220 (+),score=38.43 TRINITY_DN5550_c0_g1_i1:79-738(+)
MISILIGSFFFGCFVTLHYVLRYFFEGYRFTGRNFVFDAKILQEVAKKGIGKSSNEEMFEAVHQELERLYPDHIWKKREWQWFNSGGWMGTMCFLHASLTEYVILFGSSCPTSGHSGRYPLEVFDFVMEGEYSNQYELTTELHTYKPGDRSYLPSMKSCVFCVKDHVWMLEYGRGLLPFSLPFQMMGTLFTTLDYTSMFRMQLTYAKYLLYELTCNWKI